MKEGKKQRGFRLDLTGIPCIIGLVILAMTFIIIPYPLAKVIIPYCNNPLIMKISLVLLIVAIGAYIVIGRYFGGYSTFTFGVLGAISLRLIVTVSIFILYEITVCIIIKFMGR